MCPTPSNQDMPDTQSLLCSLPLSFANFSASGLCAPATFLSTADSNLSTFASKYTGSLPTCSPAVLAPPPAPAISAATSDTPTGPKAQSGGGANAGAIAGGLTRAVSHVRTEPIICPAADGDGCAFVRDNDLSVFGCQNYLVQLQNPAAEPLYQFLPSLRPRMRAAVPMTRIHLQAEW